MGNVSDYLRWRGDLTFDKDSFNNVDNLILAQLAYVDFDDIIPGMGKGSITLAQAAGEFFELHSEDELKKVKTFIKDVPFFMRSVANTERFCNVMLSDYINVVDVETEKQFAAFHINLPDDSVYITFRGTDDSIVGWKEDFNMSFMSPVPSQLEAVEYVEQTMKNKKKMIRLGGHSKGGNLAIYSAVNVKSKLQDRIIEVYNNDGPGFDSEMIHSEEYQKMLPKIKTIVPYQSFVGMLLEHDEDYMVVKSSQRGIMQHDAMSWQVIGNKFQTHRKVSKSSLVINEAFSKWILGMDKEQRAKFVETLFSILTASGANTLSDVNADLFKSAGAAIKMFNSLDSETRVMMSKMLKSLTGEISKARKRAK